MVNRLMMLTRKLETEFLNYIKHIKETQSLIYKAQSGKELADMFADYFLTCAQIKFLGGIRHGI